MSGSEKTRAFYDQVGWSQGEHDLVDVELFGPTEVGPIRRELHDLLDSRVREAVGRVAPAELLEVGCGGSVETTLGDMCRTYTAVDFSITGLRASRHRMALLTVPGSLVQADACDLPLPDDHFDVVFSANMLYHIPEAADQARAVDEMMRVVRPGGVVVLIVANPWPLLSPVRFVRRLMATVPGIRHLADRVRSSPPLPYLPLSRRWFRRHVGARGSVEAVSQGIASTAVNRDVSEFTRLGRLRWRVILHIERRWPHLAVAGGNYTQLTITRHPGGRL